MKKLVAIVIFGLLGFGYPAFAAAQKDARILENEYFSITLPAGWKMPAPPKKQPLGGISAAFVKEGSDIAVTLNFLQGADISAKIFADKMVEDMKKSGMRASKPVLENGLYKFEIDGRARGTAWIGSDAGVCAATLVFGNNQAEANSLLKAVKPVNRKLLPAAIR